MAPGSMAHGLKKEIGRYEVGRDLGVNPKVGLV
jgi:hypothetical protein